MSLIYNYFKLKLPYGHTFAAKNNISISIDTSWQNFQSDKISNLYILYEGIRSSVSRISNSVKLSWQNLKFEVMSGEFEILSYWKFCHDRYIKVNRTFKLILILKCILISPLADICNYISITLPKCKILNSESIKL